MKVLVKGTGWGFPYMVPLKPTKTVAYCMETCVTPSERYTTNTERKHMSQTTRASTKR